MALFNALTTSGPTGLLGRLAADLLSRALQPSLKELGSVRLFAFLVPLCMYIVYFLDLVITGPLFWHTVIVWTVPFWAGVPVIAGIVSFLLSFVMFPPSGGPEEAK